MKRLLKTPLAFVWRWTAPLWRPLVGQLARACREAVSADLAAQTRELRGHSDRLHALLLQVQTQVLGQGQALAELSLALDSTVRELARLHAELDALHSAPADATPERRAAAG